MEQTNLIVTPDGKSWDEVTRDTSFIGPVQLCCSTDTADAAHAYMHPTDYRGNGGNGQVAYFNKDFAICYDRWFCLVDGWYMVYVHVFSADGGITGSDFGARIHVNGHRVLQSYQHDASQQISITTWATVYMTSGDRIQFHSATAGADEESFRIEISRIKG